jgi:glutamate formiminotransferase/formiminotetrahydrofolate cyclodeaminase
MCIWFTIYGLSFIGGFYIKNFTCTGSLMMILVIILLSHKAEGAMTSPLVECIPNFSEARRTDVVQQIIESIVSVPGVHVLDHHSDFDHNRTVVTYIGDPKSVEEAAYLAIATASKLIDLDQHTGEHPRLGATDVVPFVPISDVTMQECIEMAHRLGKKVGDELNIPVFLYEEAASIPEKQNLENIRSGQYEKMKTEIGKTPVKTPDFGPSKVDKAGATVIGARQPLIAFNIYLTSNDVSIAQKIARAVRHSSGGLRYVKGMGVLVEGRAQVSMNLTNFKKTPVARVVEFVRREAERYGVAIHHSELVGLIPQDALSDAAQWYIQLDDFKNEQILEQRLFQVMRESTMKSQEEKPDFLDQLAAATPTPGGGAAAAHTAAEGAALVAMVARLTIGKKKYLDVQERMYELIDQSEELRKQLVQAGENDSAAFEKVLQAFRLPKNTDEEFQKREQEIQKATILAAEVPLDVASMALEVMKLALEAAQTGNLNAISDAASGLFFAKSALTSASLNVRTNTLGISNQSINQKLLENVQELENQSNSLEKVTWQLLKERGGFPIP